MFQRITLMGRVGSDPKMRYLEDGTAVTSLSLATTETLPKKTANGERPCPKGWKESHNGKNWELTTWWNLTAWRGLAETINSYVTKGRAIFVEGQMKGIAADGKLSPRVWIDNAGNHRSSFEFVVRSFKFLPSSGGNGGSAGVPDDDPDGEAPPEYDEE